MALGQKGEGVNSLILSKSTLPLAPSPLGLSPAFGSPKERRWRGQLSSPRQRRGEDFLLPFFYLYLDKNKESLRRRWRVRHSPKREVKIKIKAVSPAKGRRLRGRVLQTL